MDHLSSSQEQEQQQQTMGHPGYLLPHVISDTDFNLVDFINSHWKYRGEGNANIVIALEDELRVMRLSKTKVDEGDHEDGLDWNRLKRKVMREVVFANNYLVPLLGLEYVGKVQAIQLKLEQVSILNHKLKKCRPSFRQHKELKVPYGTSHRDFARIHSYATKRNDYCIEIKPKQGWWSKHLQAALEGLFLPSQCTYCLNQFLKLKRSKIVSRTNYCPLDLFSGEPRRMVQAIVALISNPQNNFRIFKNGRLVYGENETKWLEPLLSEWMGFKSSEEPSNSASYPMNVDNMIFLLCSALLKSKTGIEAGTSMSTTLAEEEEEYMRLLTELRRVLEESPVMCHRDGTLIVRRKGESCIECSERPPKRSILGRILEVQRLGEGVDRIYQLYEKICPVHSKAAGVSPALKSHGFSSSSTVGDCTWNSSGEESGCEFGSSSSSEFSEDDDEATLSAEDIECPGLKCLESEKWLDEIPNITRVLEKKELLLLQQYLVAATAKDCSIMITFSPLRASPNRVNEDSSSAGYEESDLILRDLNGNEHRVRLGVADLDPKPVSSIVKHFLRDREMVQDFLQFCRARNN